MDASSAEGSSSSVIPPRPAYHVFVSFRGADTRKKFAGHLFEALADYGFRTFRDDKELERGEYISDGLEKAIVGSRMSLIVFSKDYADSTWCLDELAKIMDCRDTLKQIVEPIFLDVEPSDVRKQTGVLEEQFAKHHRECLQDKVEKWRAAVTSVSNLPGLTLSQANGDEAKLIKRIIKDVRENVNPTRLNVPDQQVGLELRVRELNGRLKMKSDGVDIVAIWGMGGIGKTTIAKKLYNDIQHEFERSGFLADVRETSQPRNGLEELQKKLLWEISKKSHVVHNFHEGIEDIKTKAFHGKNILLVLDDVDDVRQLKALAIDRKSFAPGSRIIITTRNKSLLNKLEVDEPYEPKALNEDESLELFSWHAFGEDHPPKDYLNLSSQIVRYAGGLPLALEVLGSYLCARSTHEWESAIEKLGSIPNEDVQGKLKLSFDSLPKELKELFLDMACFFVGTRKDFTVKILERCKKFAEIGIQDLAHRCLIKYDTGDQIVMHDMLRDMGRDIVKQESLEDPGNRSRLWYSKDVLDVLRDGTGTEKVKGLHLNAIKVQENALQKMDRLWFHGKAFEVWRDGRGTEAVEGVQVNANAFKKMDKLWLLHLDYFHINAGYEQISRKLLWLSWKGFPLEFVPSKLSMEELVALDLRYSSLKNVWIENKILGKLKFLYLSHCHYLTRTPNFSGLNCLEELRLDNCKSLVEVDESIRCLNKLLILDMHDCEKLQKLPSAIWMLESLKCLDLSGCSKLGNLAGFKGSINQLCCSFFSCWTLMQPKGVNSIGLSLMVVQASSCLKKLGLRNCRLSYLPTEIGNLTSLHDLDLCRNNLSTLPDSIYNLTCLKKLFLEGNNVSHLHSGIGGLTSLEELFLSKNSLCTLPGTIGKLSYLKVLEVASNKLSCLPCEIGDLNSLETLNLHDNCISTLPETICKLVHLVSLYVSKCNLSHLPSEFERLIKLERLYLGNNSLRALPDAMCTLTSLWELDLKGCKLSHLPSGIARLVSLEILDIGETDICSLPESVGDLPLLRHIYLECCANLRSLPKLPVCRVNARSCPSLESLPLDLDQIPKCIVCPDSNKLAENNFVSSLLKQLPKSKGLYKIRNLVHFLVPAGAEIPIWFPNEGTSSDEGSESNVSFVVPPSIKQKMLGWILRVVYSCRIRDPSPAGIYMRTVICNKIDKGSFYPYHITGGPDLDNVWLLYIPQCYRGLQLLGGDEVEIPLWADDIAIVKSWAVDLIYEADENRGDSTFNQVVSI